MVQVLRVSVCLCLDMDNADESSPLTTIARNVAEIDDSSPEFVSGTEFRFDVCEFKVRVRGF